MDDYSDHVVILHARDNNQLTNWVIVLHGTEMAKTQSQTMIHGILMQEKILYQSTRNFFKSILHNKNGIKVICYHYLSLFTPKI